MGCQHVVTSARLREQLEIYIKKMNRWVLISKGVEIEEAKFKESETLGVLDTEMMSLEREKKVDGVLDSEMMSLEREREKWINLYRN